MNKPFLTVAATLALGASVPAFAGVDFQALEQARMKQANHQGRAAPKTSVLPLDHGPRAQITPHEKRQRTARFETTTTSNARS